MPVSRPYVSRRDWRTGVGSRSVCCGRGLHKHGETSDTTGTVTVDRLSLQHMPLSAVPSWRVETYPLFLGNAAFLYLIHSVVLPVEQVGGLAGVREQPAAVVLVRRRLSLRLIFVVFCGAWQGMEHPEQYDQALRGAVAGVTAVNLVYCVPVYLFYGEVSASARHSCPQTLPPHAGNARQRCGQPQQSSCEELRPRAVVVGSTLHDGAVLVSHVRDARSGRVRARVLRTTSHRAP